MIVKTDDIAALLNSKLAPSGSYPTSLQQGVSSSKIKQLLGGDEAHLGSVNMYALHPWNDTHFSVFNINLGSSYSGAEMQVANLMWIQGIKTKVADKDFNIMFELKLAEIFMRLKDKGMLKTLKCFITFTLILFVHCSLIYITANYD